MNTVLMFVIMGLVCRFKAPGGGFRNLKFDLLYKSMYTCLKNRCRAKRVNDGQCDTMELWEDATGKFVTGLRFLIFKIFSFQDNLKSKLRHAELL